jgi:hypothetical protein
MLNIVPLLAQADLQNPEIEAVRKAAKNAPPPVSGDTGLILGAILVVVAALFFWAFFIRKRPKRHHGSMVMERARKHSREEQGSSGRRRRRKRRPDHPDNWGRNPTLGETGGLPPAKPDEPEPPPTTESAEPQR